MQNHIWAKTLLTSYRFLDRIAGAIDRIIEKKALSTSSMLGSDIYTNGTQNLADKIIELMERKVKLINIKVLTESALKKLKPLDAKLLIKKYIEKQAVESIYVELGMPRRTYFRKIGEAEAKFEANCAQMSFPSGRLESYLEKEGWIMEVKRSYEKGEIKPLQVKIG